MVIVAFMSTAGIHWVAVPIFSRSDFLPYSPTPVRVAALTNGNGSYELIASNAAFPSRESKLRLEGGRNYWIRLRFGKSPRLSRKSQQGGTRRAPNSDQRRCEFRNRAKDVDFDCLCFGFPKNGTAAVFEQPATRARRTSRIVDRKQDRNPRAGSLNIGALAGLCETSCSEFLFTNRKRW